MQIQLISNTSFFELFLLPVEQRFSGLIPNTMICEEGNLVSWLFNSQKDSNHTILKKNKDNISTLKFAKQLAASIDCDKIVKECSSVSDIFTALQTQFRKDESLLKEYFNQTVMFQDKKQKIPKYIRILDFLKSLSNRSFNEPQCPQGWSLFQQVTLSRMKQHELYFVEVYKPQGDLTFRFNYYKWISKGSTQQEFIEPSYYQIWQHKEIIKVYQQNLTQKILVTVLQLISFLETNYKLQIRKLVARYTINKNQQAVLKGVSQFRVIAPKKFMDYSRVQQDQTLTILEYLQIEKSLKKFPQMLVSSAPKIFKKPTCPGGFCSAILKSKLNDLDVSVPSQVISWSVIESTNNPKIIKSLIDNGLIQLPGYNLQSKKDQNNKLKTGGIKVCNKCFLVYKALTKIDKAQTDFQSKSNQLKKLDQSQQQGMKKTINSKSALTFRKNFISYNISQTKDLPRLKYSTPQKLPLISTKSERNTYKPSSFATGRVSKFAKSQSFDPILERYENNKIESPILKSIVGQKFKSKQQLKQLLFKHYKKQKDSPSKAIQNKQQGLITQNKKQRSKQKSGKSSIVKYRKQSDCDSRGQVVEKAEHLITSHLKSSESVKKMRDERSQQLTNKIYSIMSGFDKVKVSIDWFTPDVKMQINYCILQHKQKSAKSVLIIIHDLACSYVQYLQTAANLVTQQVKIVLINYPGQAYTMYSSQKLTGLTFSKIFDRLLFHLDEEQIIDIENNKFSFCGIGYGGYILKYYINMNYRYYFNWSSVIFINSSVDISQQYQKFIHKILISYKDDQNNNVSNKVLKQFYQQYYKITDKDALTEMANEMSDDGLIYLIKSSIDDLNQYIQIKSTKLKIVIKQITPLQKQTQLKKTSRNKHIPIIYPVGYLGKQTANYSLITSKKFQQVMQKFIEKHC